MKIETLSYYGFPLLGLLTGNIFFLVKKGTLYPEILLVGLITVAGVFLIHLGTTGGFKK